MKHWYDRKAKTRSFKSGDKVLVLFSVTGKPLHARFQGPYIVEKKINEMDYVIQTQIGARVVSCVISI